MAEIIITDEGHRGTVNFGLNGRIMSKPVMVAFEADETVTAALDAAGIAWESTEVTGEPTGRYTIAAGGKAGNVGNTYPLQVNGRLRHLEVGTPLTLSADELVALDNADITFTAEYAESEEEEVPGLDHEWSPDPTFDDAGAWTLNLCTISGGLLTSSGEFGDDQYAEAPATATIVAGTYHAVGTYSPSVSTGPIRVIFGGVTTLLRSTPGDFDVEFVVAAPTNNNVRILFDEEQIASLASCSVKRTA